MKIFEYMIDYTKLPEEMQRTLSEKYLEYPPKNKEVTGVLQKHCLGDSCHFDFRFPVNNHLNGWAIVGFSKDNPPTIDKLEPTKGFRAEPKCKYGECNEWKFDIWEKEGTWYYKEKLEKELSEMPENLARQPLVWLFKDKGIGETFYFKPKEVGAGIEAAGSMTVLARPKIILGSQKDFFHEYFWKDFGQFKDWTRIVIRRIKGKKLTPETKVKGKQEVLYWKFMVTKTEEPYAISSRAVGKGWRPPENIIPFPIEWTKKKFPEAYNKWIEYMKGESSGTKHASFSLKKEYMKESPEKLNNIRFTLSLVSWMGAKHIRLQPRFRWYLFLDDKESDSVRTFRIDGSPIGSDTIGAVEMERSNRKWLSYEGSIEAGSRWIETKRLEGHMSILDKGIVSLKKTEEDGRELLSLEFKGKKLKGKWKIEQYEKGTEYYGMEKLSELKKCKYVFHEHKIEGKEPHWDIRIEIEKNKLLEFNLWKNIAKLDKSRALPKMCYDSSWFIHKGQKLMKKVGEKKSYIWVLDYGDVNILEDTPTFKSFEFSSAGVLKDNRLNGYYILKKEDGIYYFEKSSLPGEERKSSITLEEKGSMLPFSMDTEEKEGWDYFYIKVHDMRKYTRCTNDVSRYLDIEIPSGVTIYICFFNRPGKIHGAEVGQIKFTKDKWTHDKAKEWIKSKNLDTWSGEMQRG